MKRKSVIFGSIAILFVLLQANGTLSRRGRGRSRSRSSYRSSSTSSFGSTSSGGWERSHHKSSKSTENSRQSSKATGHLANGSPPQHNPQRLRNYLTHYDNPSFNPSFSHNDPSNSQIFGLGEDHSDSLRKLLLLLHRSDDVTNSDYPHYGGNSRWDQYNGENWKLTSSKPTLKPTAGAVATMTTSGFLLGCDTFPMRFHFNYLIEERWWYQNCERYVDRISFLRSKEPAPEGDFVRDCWNVTMKDVVSPRRNETADEMESRVVGHVVHQMCVKQYRELPQLSRESGFQGTSTIKPMAHATSRENEGEVAANYVLSRPVPVPILILMPLFCLPAFLSY